ncbi:hypothetical protein [Sulfurovum sp.]|uniref:hypothetical protein n=1 Tax=Sulfurovum sp. TaxID=1969726 RepID=UPI0028681021|nr:hypothetical protein [Sulfurovum sp.]
MPLLFLLFALFVLSACVNTAEVYSSNGEKSAITILDNKTDAQNAQDEYKKLQAQRVQE